MLKLNLIQSLDEPYSPIAQAVAVDSSTSVTEEDVNISRSKEDERVANELSGAFKEIVNKGVKTKVGADGAETILKNAKYSAFVFDGCGFNAKGYSREETKLIFQT